MIQVIRATPRKHRIGVVGPRSAKKVSVTRGGTTLKDILPEQIQAWARLIGQRRAKDVYKLAQRGIQGTLPELLTYDWLDKKHLSFSFQYPLLGGRATRGGAVVDFIVWNLSPNGYYIWRIQGDYWHTGYAVEKKDEVQKLRLSALRVGGVPIVGVIDIWESRIYNDCPNVFLAAEIGMEKGRAA